MFSLAQLVKTLIELTLHWNGLMISGRGLLLEMCAATPRLFFGRKEVMSRDIIGSVTGRKTRYAYWS